MNQIDLKNRHAIVTGGARGIGYAVAERLLASGAHVALWDMDASKLASSVATLQAAHPGAGYASKGWPMRHSSEHAALLQATNWTTGTQLFCELGDRLRQ